MCSADDRAHLPLTIFCMVRHKTRWLLVRLEFDSDVIGRRDEDDSRNKGRRVEEDGAGLTKKDLAQCIRECISSSFGVAACGAAQDVQGMTITCIIWLEESSHLLPFEPWLTRS
jgi:hypothetical protein